MLLAAMGISFTAVPLSGQAGPELGVHGVLTAQEPALAAAGLYAAIRTTRRTRLAVTIALGGTGGEVAARGELLGHFLLNPTGRGAGFYAGGGIAGVAGPARHGYVVLLVGVEAAPGGSSGWSIEAGLGGGFRASVGYRWRWLPRAWRAR